VDALRSGLANRIQRGWDRRQLLMVASGRELVMPPGLVGTVEFEVAHE
jgi:hypothetical protein